MILQMISILLKQFDLHNFIFLRLKHPWLDAFYMLYWQHKEYIKWYFFFWAMIDSLLFFYAIYTVTIGLTFLRYPYIVPNQLLTLTFFIMHKIAENGMSVPKFRVKISFDFYTIAIEITHFMIWKCTHIIREIKKSLRFTPSLEWWIPISKVGLKIEGGLVYGNNSIFKETSLS